MVLFKKKTPKEYIIYSAIIALGIALDQLTKLLAVKFLMPINTVPILKNILHLTYVENTGAAFGMLKDHRWVFLIISTVAILAFAAYLYLGHAENMLYAVSLSMVISGGIGNMIDRLALGYVVDFIDFRLINFAVFNGADSFVCVGAGLLILALILDLKKEYAEEKAKKAVTTAETNAPTEEDKEDIAE
jgi:signal peptidase II